MKIHISQFYNDLTFRCFTSAHFDKFPYNTSNAVLTLRWQEKGVVRAQCNKKTNFDYIPQLVLKGPNFELKLQNLK